MATNAVMGEDQGMERENKGGMKEWES